MSYMFFFLEFCFIRYYMKARQCPWKMLLTYVTPRLLMSVQKKFQPIRSSRLAGYREHIYECLVLIIVIERNIFWKFQPNSVSHLGNLVVGILLKKQAWIKTFWNWLHLTRTAKFCMFHPICCEYWKNVV